VSEPGEELLLHEPKAKEENIAALVRKMISIIGEDPNREGLRKTPERFEKALKFLTSGYHQNVEHILNGATFVAVFREMPRGVFAK
jgi:GTP cyclohydrolase IA